MQTSLPLRLLLNKPLFLPLEHVPLPRLILTLFSDKPPSITAGNRPAANIIKHNLNRPRFSGG
jgi:hypothetical protein